MHVGLNLVYLTPGATGGTETYARELIPRMVAAAPQHRFTAFVNRDASATPGPWADLVERVVVPVRAVNRLEWVRGEQQLLPRMARRAGVDLLHSLANTGPGWGRFRRVVTIHDLIYEIVPEARAGLRARGMRVLVPLAARRSDRIVAIAAATSRDLQRVYRVPEAKIDVVPQGIGRERPGAATPVAEMRRRLGAADRPILLSVSAKLVHKNLVRLVGAMAAIPLATRPLLVLPGYSTPYEEAVRDRAHALGVGDDVRLLGWVSDEDLEGLYEAAAAFVFPSLYEGFGMPVLEAMARGVPVACSDRGALAEVAGDAALLLDPESEASIAAVVTSLLADRPLADDLRQRGYQRVKAFSWTATASGTLASYERAATKAPSSASS